MNTKEILKFEYRTTHHLSVDEMNELGESGWELVSIHAKVWYGNTSKDSTKMYWKRLKV